MYLSTFELAQSSEVIQLFTNVFSDSEGEAEGQQIGGLVSDLIAKTKSDNLIGFVAESHGHLAGCIFFSRLTIPGINNAFILSPVAIATREQRKGVGQQLIKYGIDCLKTLGVDWVFTYGDPNYYKKVGFCSMSETLVKAPFRLSQPQGWLAQALNGGIIKGVKSTARCVEALNDPKYW